MVIFNKSDAVENQQKRQIAWMKNYEEFLKALTETEQNIKTDFSKSICLSLDSFYKDLPCFYVSSLSGEGLQELIAFSSSTSLSKPK